MVELSSVATGGRRKVPQTLNVIAREIPRETERAKERQAARAQMASLVRLR